MVAPNRFEVQVDGLEDLYAGDRQVVYHGVNKSGSLTMTNVLYHGYYEGRRANQFFSTYRGVPSELGQLRRIIAQSDGHSFFGGHYLYGAYKARPGEQLLTTQFRNPLPRVRSCYQWMRNKSVDRGEPFPSFEEWVPATRGIAHSQIAQFGAGFSSVAREELKQLGGDEILERALENIDRDVAWFGLAEYFEESVFTMAAICGVRSVRAWEQDNRNKDRPLVDEWPQEHVDLVREVFRWDFALYDWAVARFQERLAALKFGPELDRYREACRDQYKDRLDVWGRAVR